MTTNNWRESATSTSQFAAPLAAGTYLIGDPCYAFDNDDPNGDLWNKWLDACWEGLDADRTQIMYGRVSTYLIAASGTEHGDGTYYDQDGFEYSVDAGLLGAVPVSALHSTYPKLARKNYDDLQEATGMRVVSMAVPFHVSYESGVVVIGPYRIDTNWYQEEDTCSWCGEPHDEGDCLDDPED